MPCACRRAIAPRLVTAWGEPLWDGAAALDTRGLARGALLEPGAAAAQARRFGNNCDALAYFPLDDARARGLLCVNHEYSNDELMCPGLPGWAARVRRRSQNDAGGTPRLPASARAHGVSVLKLALVDGRWRVRRVALPRRITAGRPARSRARARRALLRTPADPGGTRVLGTFANCAGGQTPWGTYLTAEENIDDYFGGAGAAVRGPTSPARGAPSLPAAAGDHHGWEHVDPRFDLRRNPREPLRYGWIVEIDPRDPTAPRKRTALGRFAHEGATRSWHATDASPSTGRRRQVRVRLQVRHARALRPAQAACEPRPARPRHAVRGALRRRRRRRLAAARPRGTGR